MPLLNPILKKKYNFNLLKVKEYFQNKKVIYATLISVLAAYSKTVLLSSVFNISQLDLRSYSIICPFITLMLCHFFLKNQKLNKFFITSFLICFVGFVIFNLTAGFAFHFNIFLLFYTLLNSYSDFKLKSVSNARGLEMMLFDNLMFLFVSTVVFVVAFFNETITINILGVQKFNIIKLLHTKTMLPLFFVAILSFLAHNFKMLTYKAKHIVTIVVAAIFFKSFNSILMTYMTKNLLPNISQTLGMLIMCLGSAFFVYKNNKKN